MDPNDPFKKSFGSKLSIHLKIETPNLNS